LDGWKGAPASSDSLLPRVKTAGSDRPADLICFSHLRWNFVFQRPQHLMIRAARSRRVFFWEEPDWVTPAERSDPVPQLRLEVANGVTVATPLLPAGMDERSAIGAQRVLLDRLLRAEDISNPIMWYYTPQAMPFSSHLTTCHPVIYDCMDELSAFLGADRSLPARERALLDRADLVFTGGFSLYEVKRHQHADVHPFPSGVDLAHFRPARGGLAEPPDQSSIPHPRIGFYGVIDERLDISLLAQLATLRPDWQIVLVGPVAKVDPETLPKAPNIHYLGGKKYEELPAYLAGWDVALMPFARNDATRFISPTKTPEYLAGGKPVVSTPITDVVRHYGRVKAVRIADSAPSFVEAIEDSLHLSKNPQIWLAEADEMLAAASWSGIWSRMMTLVDRVAAEKAASAGGSQVREWS
jgi:UDP-galactopyranose mutase